MSLTISRYKGGRNWAVREADTGSLVVVTVCRKGAVEVVRRLTGAIPEPRIFSTPARSIGSAKSAPITMPRNPRSREISAATSMVPAHRSRYRPA